MQTDEKEKAAPSKKTGAAEKNSQGEAYHKQDSGQEEYPPIIGFCQCCERHLRIFKVPPFKKLYCWDCLTLTAEILEPLYFGYGSDNEIKQAMADVIIGYYTAFAGSLPVIIEGELLIKVWRIVERTFAIHSPGARAFKQGAQNNG